MKIQQILIKKKVLVLCILALLPACAKKALVESVDMTATEIESMKADLKLEMIAPPKSKKLAEHLITSIEVDPFVIQGGGDKEFAQMINDKIIARIDDGGYVQVVQNSGEATLSGTLRIGQMEKFQEQGTSGAEIFGEGDQQLESGGGSDAATVGGNILGSLTASVLAGGLVNKSNGQQDIAVKKTNVKRMSAVIAYKLMKDDKLIDSGDIKKELNEKQSAYVLSQTALAQESSSLISDPEMTNKLLDIIADSVVAEISPHPQLFPFNWMDTGCSGNDDFDLGLKYAKQSLDSEAEGLWKKLEITAKEGECRAAALYNLGLLKLRADPKSNIKQTEAYHMFVEADALNRGNDIIMPAVRKLKRIAFTKFTPLDPSLKPFDFSLVKAPVKSKSHKSSRKKHH
ncbi:MAG: hypothetical protein EPN89_13740 [Methylovulum sp.]|nr:MAG: hypothetical protein EPN89_13740 [Methylovulum sp.]